MQLLATVERFRAALPGSTATTSQASTGSFGSGTPQVVTTYGEQTRDGAPVLTATSPAGTMLMRPTDGNRIGFVGPNGQLQWTLDPPVGFRYPLESGKSWTVDTRMTLFPGNRVISVERVWQVHGLEDVKVPAGSFKALRITVSDRMAGTVWNEDTFWLDPGQELLVRSSLRRQAAHPAGAGTRDTELLSHTIKRN